MHQKQIPVGLNPTDDLLALGDYLYQNRDLRPDAMAPMGLDETAMKLHQIEVKFYKTKLIEYNKAVDTLIKENEARQAEEVRRLVDRDTLNPEPSKLANWAD